MVVNMSCASGLDQLDAVFPRADADDLRVEMQILLWQSAQHCVDVLLPVTVSPGSSTKWTRAHAPPLIVSQLGLPVSWRRWWLWKKRIKVEAGKSSAA